jgi:hypothetical protein
VVAGASAILEDAGLADRCEAVPCDFFVSVPGGGDLYLLKYIIHDWLDEQALMILKTCRRAMPEHSRILLVENIIQPGNNPDPARLIDLQMLVEVGGRERTAEEFRTLLHEAGLELTRCIPTQTPLYLIEAIPV